MSENFILKNLGKPEILEGAYRDAPDQFESQLEEAIEQNKNSETLRVWQARVTYVAPTLAHRGSVIFLVLLCLISGLLVKLPSMFILLDGDWYYPRFVPLITIVALVTYFLWTVRSSTKMAKKVIIGISFCTAYLLLLPEDSTSDSVTMALIHLPMASFSLLALSFMANDWNSVKSRIGFIRYVGEMGILTVLIILGGMILTGFTLGLFSLIGMSIDEWYWENIVVLGLISAPIVATYLFDTVQHRQSKFAPMLANVFAPLFLITILAYLIATVYQGKSPYTDRDFLITFNGLLLVILVLAIFSISGKVRTSITQTSDYINVALVSATLIVNVVALSAIVFRWAEYGMTINRIVVTGANIVVFVHLILLLKQYVNLLRKGKGIYKLEAVIARYLPVYTVWSIIVSVALPLAFQYK